MRQGQQRGEAKNNKNTTITIIKKPPGHENKLPNFITFSIISDLVQNIYIRRYFSRIVKGDSGGKNGKRKTNKRIRGKTTDTDKEYQTEQGWKMAYCEDDKNRYCSHELHAEDTHSR